MLDIGSQAVEQDEEGDTIMLGSIRTGDGMICKGGCYLIFEEKCITVKWPTIISYHEDIGYMDILTIFHSKNYSKIKIVYLKNGQKESIVFLSSPILMKKELLSDFVQTKLKYYGLSLVEYSLTSHGFSKIFEWMRFWVFYNSSV